MLTLEEVTKDAALTGIEPRQPLRRVEGALDTEHLRSILHRNALCEEVMGEEPRTAHMREARTLGLAFGRLLPGAFLRARNALC